jgi:hypothetical protein
MSTETVTSLKLRVGLSGAGATRLMTDPGSVPEAGGSCHVINTAVDPDVEDCEPA